MYNPDLRYSLSFSTFCLLRASSSVGALDKRSGDEHHVIGSFSTDPEEDEFILNEEKLRPVYSQTEDTEIDGDFRPQGIKRNLRDATSKKCVAPRKATQYGSTLVCGSECISSVSVCKTCVSQKTYQ